MKKITLCMMTFSLLLVVVSTQLKAASLRTSPVVGDSIAVVEKNTVNTLLARLDEISSIDKANLRPPERKELRQEVRSIKRQLKAINNGGVYISVGTLLVVIILLILLL